MGDLNNVINEILKKRHFSGARFNRYLLYTHILDDSLFSGRNRQEQNGQKGQIPGISFVELD
jgi:hypothetical protein